VSKENIDSLLQGRVDQLNKCLNNIAESQYQIDDYNWAQGRKEQINWELEFLEELKEVLEHTLIIS